MKAYIFTNLVGVFCVSDKGELIAKKFFGKDPSYSAKKFWQSRFGLIEEERELFEEMKKQNVDVYFVVKKDNFPFEYDERVEKLFKKNFLEFCYEEFKDITKLFEFLSLAGSELARIAIKESIGRDPFIIQAIRAVEELDKSINILVERLREWYGYHFPEMEKIVSDHKKFAELVAKFGRREKIEGMEDLASRSMGTELKDLDEEILKEYSKTLLKLFELRSKLVDYLEKNLKEFAPNLQNIAGTILAAKLISKAGSLEKLAKAAASTIQLMGAEKALFRFLRGRGKSPKHGIIFIHPYIQKAPKKLRGKIARALASKLSMAAKIDFYSKELRPKLKQDLEERIKEIMEEYEGKRKV